jgi:hypothetical protein
MRVILRYSIRDLVWLFVSSSLFMGIIVSHYEMRRMRAQADEYKQKIHSLEIWREVEKECFSGVLRAAHEQGILFECENGGEALHSIETTGKCEGIRFRVLPGRTQSDINIK